MRNGGAGDKDKDREEFGKGRGRIRSLDGIEEETRGTWQDTGGREA